MRRVLYYEVLQFQPENVELLRRHCAVCRLPNPDHDTPELLRTVEAVFAPLGYCWDQAKIDQAPQLRVIASNTTGASHIDTHYAAQKGVRVVSLKDHPAFLTTITPTAELTWGLMLGVVRRIPWAFQGVCQGAWNRRLFGSPAMLSAMSLGVVGLGRLGAMVARQAKSFCMDVRYYDREERSVPGVTRAPSLEALVAQADVVTVHLPLERETERLFDDRVFACCKPGAYFINTSRGELVDSDALLRALAGGTLAGAALDVLDGEFEPGFAARVHQHPLVAYARTHDNLLITPHIGGSTVDAWRRTEAFTIRLVLEALQGRRGAS